MTDILPLLDELQALAREGLHYAENPYDIGRYEKLMKTVTTYYGQALDLPPADVRARLSAELGCITPKVGADAAIFDVEGRILLHQRADNTKWCLPCGWVDVNEAPIDAAVREAREETGLVVRPLELVGVFPRPANAEYGTHSLISVVYLCEVIGGTLTLSHEGLDLRYWAIEDMTEWHATHRHYAVAARDLWQQKYMRD